MSKAPRAKWYQNLNRYKIGAVLAAVAGVLMQPKQPETWAALGGVVLAAFSGDKNTPADAP